MTIILGAGRDRFEVEVHWGYLWFSVPKIGEGFYHKSEGWVFDRWAEVVRLRDGKYMD